MTTQTTAPATSADLLAPSTSMGAVTLYVRDLDAMTAFYRDALALDVLDERTLGEAFAALTDPEGAQRAAGRSASRTGEVTVLGRGETPAMVLRREPDLPAPLPGQAGLFHTAILFDDAAALAATVLRVAHVAGRTFTGSADHLVSEAFYFTDPEGNGVELYHDRPRETWTWTDGTVAMDTRYLDPQAFIEEHLTPEGLERPGYGGAGVGHVHLQVGDLAAAKDFYVGTLGFEATAQLPGALFVSAGGYHHHMAMNTWGSRGAGPRAATLGLGQVAIEVPTADDLDALRSRLRDHGLEVRDDGRTLRVDDPWRNLIEVTAASGR